MLFTSRIKLTTVSIILFFVSIWNGIAQGVAVLAGDTVGQKPNIIFILTDDLGYGDLGVFFQNQLVTGNAGHPRQFTPHLDQMAKEGALLPQQYSPAPVCAPSRASLLLGRSQGHSNVRDNQFDKALDNNYTLGSVLQKAGYTTAAIGKWGLQGKDDSGPNWTAHPLNRGFDYFLGYIRHRDGHEHYPKEGVYRGSKEVYENRTNIAQDLDKCYTADLWTAAAKRWIVDYKKGTGGQKPFFMFLAYDTPHAVLELPTQAYPKGGGLDGGLQWLGQPGHMINTASGKVDSWMHPDYSNATYDDDRSAASPQVPWPDIYKRYATDTRRIDDAVGDLLHLLKDLNIDDNTMVVFTSDNGPSIESYITGEPIVPTFFKSFGPFDGIKRDCWEGGLRMPSIARWPKHIPAGNIVETPSIFYDWMPTFTQIAGLPAPAVSDGVSLLPSLLKKGKQPESQIYLEYFEQGTTPEFEDFAANHRGRRRNQMQMVRLDNFVGVRYDIKSQHDDFEIYDVVKDPQQTNNLARTSNTTSLQRRMKDRVLQSRIPNVTAPRPYDDAPVPAVKGVIADPGIQWKAYEGDFPWVPAVATLTPTETGMSDYPNGNVGKVKSSGALYFEGYMRIPREGEYRFFIKTNTTALFKIHNATVIDADYEYFSNTVKAGTINLTSGLHPFRLFLTSPQKGNPTLDLEWCGPGLDKEKIPATVFFHTEE
ncbi:sulfatase-like hydrolase/transferase [Flavobacteriaceae bacterium F89]|uniref:Sulfatase-like hydrolase/transferase n=1 Tax=Cerina litoralis TaxID=2874477 RepID=A0AAE3JNA3_9FLAO|nr:sulfatase-like hydrolase/transferase [Cerina litoralis]MCG2460740.1 sulfatase-like hydrolase/transferase [Cerina litoralis]